MFPFWMLTKIRLSIWSPIRFSRQLFMTYVLCYCHIWPYGIFLRDLVLNQVVSRLGLQIGLLAIRTSIGVVLYAFGFCNSNEKLCCSILSTGHLSQLQQVVIYILKFLSNVCNLGEAMCRFLEHFQQSISHAMKIAVRQQGPQSVSLH